MPGEGLSQQKSSVYTHCMGESRKNWENDIFSPFLYCLWFIWTHASSGLKVSRSFMSLRPKKQFSLGKEDSYLACARALWPLPHGAHFCSRPLKKQNKEISQ